jgi:hypothetical protein
MAAGWTLLGWLVVGGATAQAAELVVFELVSDTEIAPNELRVLGRAVWQATVEGVRDDVVVVSSSAALERLDDDARIAANAAASAPEAGHQLKTDYVLAGQVSAFDGGLALDLELYEVSAGRLLRSGQAFGPTMTALRDAAAAAVAVAVRPLGEDEASRCRADAATQASSMQAAALSRRRLAKEDEIATAWMALRALLQPCRWIGPVSASWVCLAPAREFVEAYGEAEASVPAASYVVDTACGPLRADAPEVRVRVGASAVDEARAWSGEEATPPSDAPPTADGGGGVSPPGAPASPEPAPPDPPVVVPQ